MRQIKLIWVGVDVFIIGFVMACIITGYDPPRGPLIALVVLTMFIIAGQLLYLRGEASKDREANERADQYVSRHQATESAPNEQPPTPEPTEELPTDPPQTLP